TERGGTARFADGVQAARLVPKRNDPIGSRTGRIKEIKCVRRIMLTFPFHMAIGEKGIHPNISLRKGEAVVGLRLVGDDAFFLVQFTRRNRGLGAIETLAGIFGVSGLREVIITDADISRITAGCPWFG